MTALAPAPVVSFIQSTHVIPNTLPMPSSQTSSLLPILKDIRMNLGKPQYKAPAVFVIRAGIKYDIYHLYCYGKSGQTIYYGIAYIPNYKTSVFMNSIFRKIRENVNIDAIEESDDEDEFENTREDKWVNLEKEVAMECIFHSKFKKWVPKRVIEQTKPKIVHISDL
jgi:hypothetical protein